MRLPSICALFVTTLLTSPALSASSDQTPPSAKTTVYKNVSIIDGTGAPLRSGMTIVIKDDRIDAVVPTAKVKAPADAEVVDGSGWYAVPGLIDSHVHMATDPDRKSAEAIMRRYLYGGITTVRDMAGDVRALADLSRAALMKEIPAPDLHYVALMAAPNFFHDRRTIASARGATPGQVPWMQSVTPETDMPLAVAMSRGTWATAIKIYANLEAPMVDKITAEAHRQGFLVWAHGMVFPATPRNVVDAGVDSISHVCYIAYEGSGVTPQGYHDRQQPDYAKLDPTAPVYRDLFRDMAKKNIVLDPTLRIYAEREKQIEENKNSDFPYHCPTDFAARLTKLAIDQGVVVSAGTDGRTPIEDAYPALHEEIELIQNRVGLSPIEAIKVATYGGAKSLGKEKDLGTIEAGKLANIVFVTKNPAENVSNLRSVVTTVKRGTAYPRTDYVPITKDEAPKNF